MLLSAMLIALTTSVAAHQPASAPAGQTPRVTLAADSVAVPLRIVAGRPILDARINGRGPYPLLLDTGAHGSVLDLALARELKLPIGKAVDVSSPGGQGIQAQIVTLERLEIGGLSVLGATGAAVEGLPFPPGPDAPRGILSPYQLGGVLVTIDYPHRQALFRRGALPEPDGREVFGWESGQDLPQIPVSVAGHALRIHLDSGAQGGLSVPTAFIDSLPLSTPVSEVGRARTMDRELVIRGAKLAGTVQLGRYMIENPDVVFVDLLEHVGNIGPALLQQFAITIDTAHRRLRLDGPADGRLHAAEVQPRRYGIRFTALDATPFDVVGVDPGSPADRGGLRSGDQILSMNGRAVDSLDVQGRLQALRASPLRLRVKRGDSTLSLELALE